MRQCTLKLKSVGTPKEVLLLLSECKTLESKCKVTVIWSYTKSIANWIQIEFYSSNAKNAHYTTINRNTILESWLWEYLCQAWNSQQYLKGILIYDTLIQPQTKAYLASGVCCSVKNCLNNITYSLFRKWVSTTKLHFWK